MSILEALFRTRRVTAPDLPAWWQASAAGRNAELGVDRALLAGASADRLGYAFAGGYAAALDRLVPDLGAGIACLCATEEEGNHPRAIKSTLEPRGDHFVLSGEKRWATLAPLATQALVVASTGEREGRNALVVARVDLAAKGVELAPMPDTPFVPEVPHASLRFREVTVPAERILPGDGYVRYLKPFRTIEDLHVHAALLGYLFGVGRRSSWGSASLERMLVLALAARELADDDPLAPATHVALAGILSATESLLGELEPAWGSVDPPEALRWRRDRPLLGVAGKAREARRKRAREELGLPDATKLS